MGANGRRSARWIKALRRFDERPALVEAAKRAREHLPGDNLYGDPLSTAGSHPQHVLGRQLAAVVAERQSALREAGLGALQVWQALSEAQGRGYGEREATIMFADIEGFSSWALTAGDESAIELLRQVDLALSDAIAARGGRVVKRLGDGLMAVFDGAQNAVEAALDALAAAASIEVAGHSPRLRFGVHAGRPRKLGGDYLGIDVNIASRVAEAARGGEVLVSETALSGLDLDSVALLGSSALEAKGAPAGLLVHGVARASA
jgi:adenylate cyclase